MKPDAIEVIRGTLDLLILRTLSTSGRMHGFEILKWVFDATDGALNLEEGSLYPALHRMESRGLLVATWDVSPKGRRAKYYTLSDAGRDELRRQQTRWKQYVAAVRKIDAVADEV